MDDKMIDFIAATIRGTPAIGQAQAQMKENVAIAFANALEVNVGFDRARFLKAALKPFTPQR
jgi:hypothetical protein